MKAHRRIALCGLLAGVVAFGHAEATPTAPSPNISDIAILEIAWSATVAQREPTGPSRGSLRAGPLVFWTRLAGRNAALSELERLGRLPIHHRWWRYTGGGIPQPQDAIELSDLEFVRDQPLDAGRADVVDALKREVDGRTFFDWRTWSSRDYASKGTYCVEVVFDDGAKVPLMAPDVQTTRGGTCRFLVNVLAAQ